MTVAAVTALSVPLPRDRQSQVVPRAPRPDSDGGFFCFLFYYHILRRSIMTGFLIALAIILLIAVLIASTYNKLVKLVKELAI